MKRRAIEVLAGVVALTVAGGAVGTASANSVIAGQLGTALNYAILAGPNVQDFALNGPGTTNGNVGIDGSDVAQLNASGGHKAINGNVYSKSGAGVNNLTQITGSVFMNQGATLDAAWNSATAASAAFNNPSLFAVDRTATSLTTINATGLGTYVVDLNGDLSGNLTINGSSTDTVIINITGKLQLNSNTFTLAGGLTNADVVYNFLGTSGGDLQTSGGLNNESVINGILLATGRKIGFAPGLVNGEIIAGGQQLHLVSGACVSGGSAQTVPLPAAVWSGMSLIGAMGAYAWRKRRLRTQ